MSAEEHKVHEPVGAAPMTAIVQAIKARVKSIAAAASGSPSGGVRSAPLVSSPKEQFEEGKLPHVRDSKGTARAGPSASGGC